MGVLTNCWDSRIEGGTEGGVLSPLQQQGDRPRQQIIQQPLRQMRAFPVALHICGIGHAHGQRNVALPVLDLVDPSHSLQTACCP